MLWTFTFITLGDFPACKELTLSVSQLLSVNVKHMFLFFSDIYEGHLESS